MAGEQNGDGIDELQPAFAPFQMKIDRFASGQTPDGTPTTIYRLQILTVSGRAVVFATDIECRGLAAEIIRVVSGGLTIAQEMPGKPHPSL